tara:strand:+ start:207 stop:410 length:204 start_codon:yes stop_codon:yes gene_type:complete
LDKQLNGKSLMKLSADKLALAGGLCEGNGALAGLLFKCLREENERAAGLISQMREDRRQLIKGLDAN